MKPAGESPVRIVAGEPGRRSGPSSTGGRLSRAARAPLEGVPPGASPAASSQLQRGELSRSCHGEGRTTLTPLSHLFERTAHQPRSLMAPFSSNRSITTRRSRSTRTVAWMMECYRVAAIGVLVDPESPHVPDPVRVIDNGHAVVGDG